jgi:hypothetical protein
MSILRRSIVAVALCLLASSGLPAAPADAVKRSGDNGLKFLRQIREQPSGVKNHPIGAVALWALTLLECDVPATDPAIKAAAAELRQASLELTHNYSISLAILFFDRLGDPEDSYLIQSLGVRLLAGQTFADGWSYKSPPPDPDESRRLSAWLQGRARAKGTRQSTTLPAELQEQVRQLRSQALPNAGELGDNSNTQFAVMALWIARRYGVPVEDALSRVNTRFRRSQNADGGWSYVPSRTAGGEGSTPSMTCAGLLALAMSHAVAVEAIRRENPRATATQLPVEPAKDPVIRAALIALGNAIRNEKSRTFYFLWSLERVGVAYNLPTIGELDWHTWGAEILFVRQRGDGGWRGEEGSDVDTSFALLFLRQANLTRDLSAALKGVKDPGQSTLKATGIGADSLPPESALPSKLDSAPLPKGLDPEAAKLCQELLQAAADRQQPLIERLRDTKGVIYTDALATVIPRLAGPTQDKARDALAERFTRMSASTLRAKLSEEDIEVRVAAIRACATKEDKAHVADLIPLLADPQQRVARASQSALKVLTGRDAGLAANATAPQRAKAVADWQAWWQKQAGK